VLLGFRCHIIVAGADACSFPAIGYGSFRKPLMRWSLRLSMRRAATILPVHASLERFDQTYSELGPVQQGYAHFVPGLRTPSIAIPYGFDTDLWRNSGTGQDRRRVLCVATGAAQGSAVHFRKGVDLIIDAAARMPQLRFTIVGVDVTSYRGIPANVQLLGRVAPVEMSALMARHGIYLQPSVMEGFPNALCEAMLSGCIPIVSNVTSMPDIVGPAGLVIMKRDSTELCRAMERLSSMWDQELNDLRKAAIQRVVGFTMHARVHALLSITRSS
jgi:glycosyltransferase involved in cell wall biosynthesis